jgi:hypothetical protein
MDLPFLVLAQCFRDLFQASSQLLRFGRYIETKKNHSINYQIKNQNNNI